MELVGFRSDILAAAVGRGEVKRQTEAVAYEVRDLARQYAPYVTGATWRSLAVEDVSDPRSVEFHVGWDRDIAWYPPLVELGTEDTPAQPHLRPAADEINRR